MYGWAQTITIPGRAGIRDVRGNQAGSFRLERLNGRFKRMGVKVIEWCGEAVTKTGGVAALDAEDLVDELVFVDEPAFGALDDGDLVGFKATTAAENGLATVDLVCFEAVCHLIFSKYLIDNEKQRASIAPIHDVGEDDDKQPAKRSRCCHCRMPSSAGDKWRCRHRENRWQDRL